MKADRRLTEQYKQIALQTTGRAEQSHDFLGLYTVSARFPTTTMVIFNKTIDVQLQWMTTKLVKNLNQQISNIFFCEVAIKDVMKSKHAQDPTKKVSGIPLVY